ncbi:MAG: DUF4382 domain-containing protein [Myxococcota bacterium]
MSEPPLVATPSGGATPSASAEPAAPAAPADPQQSSGTSSGGAPSSVTPAPGRFQVKLVDAPADGVSRVTVTIKEVMVDLPDAGLATLAQGPLTVDLLTLQNGAFLDLGGLSLPEGEVSQLRFRVDGAGPNELGFSDGGTAPLTIPSGEQSGIKLPGPFQVRACATTRLTVDFDARQSLQVTGAGNSGRFLLRPVVFVKAVESTPDACAAPEVDAGLSDAPDAGADPDQLADAGTPVDAPDAGTSPDESPDAGT